MRSLGLLLLVLVAAPPEPDVPNPGGHWKRLGPPRTGEWRDIFHEKAQTFRQYKDAGPMRPTGQRKRLYLQPFLTRPPRDPDVLKRIAATLKASYGRPCAILPAKGLPASAYDPKRRQVNVLRLVPHLVATLPADGLLLLAVTDRDINLGKVGHAYGWASFRHRVGIVSTARVGARTEPKVRRRRILTLAVHEAGHTLSVPHCLFYPCLMNGARTMSEADRRPFLLCPVCRSKVCWNLDLDPLRRYRAVAAELKRQGLEADRKAVDAALDVTQAHKKG